MTDFVSSRFDRLSVLLAVHVLPGTGEPVHRNRPSHGLAYHCDGGVVYHFDNGISLAGNANTVIFLPKDTNYFVSGISQKTAGNGVFAINFNVSEELDLPCFRHVLRNPDPVFTDFRDAEAAWRTKPAGYYEQCCKFLYDILYRLKNEMALQYLPNSQSRIIAPAAEYIRAHYTDENISVGALASMCGISEVYLRRLFRLTYGMSPVRYINNLKLQRAKELIDTGEYSIGASCLQSGFFDASYFSREFRKKYGVSPTDYRRKSKGPGPL